MCMQCLCCAQCIGWRVCMQCIQEILWPHCGISSNHCECFGALGVYHEYIGGYHRATSIQRMRGLSWVHWGISSWKSWCAWKVINNALEGDGKCTGRILWSAYMHWSLQGLACKADYLQRCKNHPCYRHTIFNLTWKINSPSKVLSNDE